MAVTLFEDSSLSLPLVFAHTPYACVHMHIHQNVVIENYALGNKE